MNAPRKPVGKSNNLCIAIGGDKRNMQITLATQLFAALETEALVSYVFEETDPVQGRIAELDQATAGLLRKLAKSGELTGKMLEFTLIHAPASLKAARLLLVGAGKREQWNTAVLRKLAGAALRYLKARSVKNFALLVREGHATGDSAQAMAKEAGLAVQILDEKKIADLKMGALLSVAQGSVEPPRVMVVTYTPANAKPGAPTIGLIGKAVTFDTGGISIKPADGMEKMKYDMAGGATMLGVMRAIAALKPSVKVICVVPSTENMPGGKAQKPGDIQTAMSGKTIEVLNTDAEGRLLLADAVHYAKQLGATQLIDAATLTGAIVVALANVNVGVFGSDQSFTDKFLASSKAAGEKMWQMPIDDDYRDFIKGTVADIQNISSGKGGGATIGAMFIKEFTGDTPSIHLDLARHAWNRDAKPWLAKGPTGVALRTLVHLVLSY